MCKVFVFHLKRTQFDQCRNLSQILYFFILKFFNLIQFKPISLDFLSKCFHKCIFFFSC